MASTNIIQWNPAQANQESDSSYSADSTRSGGAVNQIFQPQLANKLFYQLSTVLTAFAQAMVGKGYDFNDANLSVLEAVLANIITNADLPLPVSKGGTGMNSPSLISGTAISISGSWPNQTIAFTLGDPVGIAYGGTGASSLSAAGIPQVVASPTTFASGPISPSTLYTPGSAGAYRVSWQAFAAAGSVGTGLTVAVTWTQGGAAHTINSFANVVSTDTQASAGSVIVFPDASTPIQFSQTQSYGSAYVLRMFAEAM